jgi:hypothetical protein
MRLDQEDIRAIAEIIQDYIGTQGHSQRVSEYPGILQAIADGMCSDDAIITDGIITEFIHG